MFILCLFVVLGALFITVLNGKAVQNLSRGEK